MAIAPWVNSFVVLAIFLIPLQQGYIHPDEFFQSPEVVAGAVLDVTVHKSWEFLPDFPCRTIVWPTLVSGLPYILARWLQMLGIARLDSQLLLWAPRLVCAFLMACVLSWITKICSILTAGRQRGGRLRYAAVFPALLVFGIRPLSNTVETALFARLLLDTMPLQDLKACRKSRNVRAHRIGMLVISGFFNRPTFLAFIAYPVLLWLSYLWKTERPLFASAWKTAKSFFPLIRHGGLAALWAFLLYVGMDTLYFNSHKLVCWYTVDSDQRGFINFLPALPKCYLPEPPVVVFTPINWLQYNIQSSKLAEHGLHPRFTHALVNMPLLFGLLAPVAYLSLAHLLVFRKPQLTAVRFIQLPVVETLQAQRSSKDAIVMAMGSRQEQKHAMWCFALLLGSIFLPLLALSSAPHQEPRFLMPLAVPLLVLYGHYLAKKRWWWVFSVGHMVAVYIFFGVLHQGGLTQSLHHLHNQIYPRVQPSVFDHHLVFFRTFMPPRHLLVWPADYQDQMNVHDLAGAHWSVLHELLARLHKDWEKSDDSQHVWLAAPASVSFRNLTTTMLLEDRQCTWLSVPRRFGPHFSSEAPARWLTDDDCLLIDNKCRAASQQSGLGALHAFWSFSLRLNLYKVNFQHMSACNQTAEVQIGQMPQFSR